MRLGPAIPIERLGVRPIVMDYLRGAKNTQAFFAPYPKSLEALCQNIPEDRWDSRHRAQLVEKLLAYQTQFGASKKTLENAKQLAHPGTFAIITGQQPGFLLGPLYTLLKIASAIKLASDLQTRGIHAVPVFWNHAEDHDLDETNHAFFVNANQELQKFRLPYSNEKKFLSEVLLDDEAKQIFMAAAQTLPQSEFSAWATELFAPRMGKSLAQEATRILLQLFAEHGLVIVEPDSIRELSHVPLVQILQQDLLGQLNKNRQAVIAAGYQPVMEENHALFFARVGEQRQRIDLLNGKWQMPKGQPLANSELAKAIEEHPGDFSPSALLRPISQYYSLPQLAYIGGPAEIAYSAENYFLFRQLNMQPIYLPRFSATFIEPSVEKLLLRFALEPKDIFQAQEVLLTKLPLANPLVIDKLQQLEKDTLQKLNALDFDLREIDPSLLGPLSRTHASVQTNLEKFRHKVVQAAQNQAGIGQRQMKKIASCLFPHNGLQERTLNPLHFLARHGLNFIHELVEITYPFSLEHRLIYWHE